MQPRAEPRPGRRPAVSAPGRRAGCGLRASPPPSRMKDMPFSLAFRILVAEMVEALIPQSNRTRGRRAAGAAGGEVHPGLSAEPTAQRTPAAEGTLRMGGLAGKADLHGGFADGRARPPPAKEGTEGDIVAGTGARTVSLSRPPVAARGPARGRLRASFGAASGARRPCSGSASVRGSGVRRCAAATAPGTAPV